MSNDHYSLTRPFTPAAAALNDGPPTAYSAPAGHASAAVLLGTWAELDRASRDVRSLGQFCAAVATVTFIGVGSQGYVLRSCSSPTRDRPLTFAECLKCFDGVSTSKRALLLLSSVHNNRDSRHAVAVQGLVLITFRAAGAMSPCGVSNDDLTVSCSCIVLACDDSELELSAESSRQTVS